MRTPWPDGQGVRRRTPPGCSRDRHDRLREGLSGRDLRRGATRGDPFGRPEVYRLEGYFFLRVARFLVARFFVARFLVARFFVARFLVARFLVARFFVVRFFAVRFFAGFLFFVDRRFFAVAISTSSKVGQDCRCTYRIVTSLHVSSGTAHELYITLPYLSEKFYNLATQIPVIIQKGVSFRSR